MWVFRTLTYGGYAVMEHGTREQKERLLPRVARGELSFCFGLTEPQAGSDAAAVTTRAVAADGGYVINGQKVFTSGMDISDYCLLVTRTADGAQASSRASPISWWTRSCRASRSARSRRSASARSGRRRCSTPT